MRKPSQEPNPKSASPGKTARSVRSFFARDSRDHLWSFLDMLDARPLLKRTLLVGIPILVIAAGLGGWGYHRWARSNSIRIARQWLDAGRLDRAGLSIQQAIDTEPDQPASWRLASELAWRKGNKAGSVAYARKAAEVGGYRPDDVLAWAEAAVLSDDTAQAVEAMGHLDGATRTGSARALRLAGEMDRRAARFTEARDAFQAALQVDGLGTALDEVPLGVVCVQTGSPADRSRGLSLLSKWAPDRNWGAEALRTLLQDAAAHGELEAAARWADQLRRHPRFTVGDIPTCLRALADFDPARLKAMLTPIEDNSRSNPNRAAQLLGWLTQIGDAPGAIRWGETLDPTLARKPPVVQGIAEALRVTRRWAELQAWVDGGDWGSDIGFLGWAYGMVAARGRGEGTKADSLWQNLRADGERSAAHAMFAGDALYAWGYPREAAALLWEASDRPDLAYQALGTLARFYQVQRDAVGEYRAFSRLNAMKPDDRNIANNFAYFASVTDLGSQGQVVPIAERNFESEPANVFYRCTYACVLVWTGRGSQAMSILEPVSGGWKKSPVVAFAYGSALASVGRKDEAREVFGALDTGRLSPQETEWVAAALR